VLLGGLATTLVLAKRRTLFCASSRTFVAAFIGFAGLWLTMIVFEATIQAYVQYEHYNFMITGPAAVALAGVLRWLPRRALSISPRRAGVLVPLLAASVLLPQALLDYGTVTALAAPVTRAVRAWYLPGMAILSVFAGGVGLLCVAWGARRAVPAAGLAFGVACAFTLAGVGPFHLSPACRDMRDNYLLVDDATRWLASEGWHVNTRSWFPPHDVLARADGCGDFDLIWTFRAIEQAGMLWKINLSPVERIADLDQRDVRNIAEKPRPRLVIFSQPSMAETYNQQLIAWGRTSGVNPIPRRQEIRTFERGSLSITIQVYRFR
jgi:hypothetical protein